MLQEYTKDGRVPLDELYQAYDQLATKYGWQRETIFEQSATLADGQTVQLPMWSFRTQTAGPALWVLAGIHGEEPAGPIAIAQHIEEIAQLAGQGVPMVVIPMCNPSGYRRNWRYQNEYRDENKGFSVGDSEHVLPDVHDPTKPRLPQATSPAAAALADYVIRLSPTYPPQLVIDHHEDESEFKPYIYSHGSLGSGHPIARHIVDLLANHGVELEMQGTTRFGEPIVYGIVDNKNDGSIDELLSTAEIIINGQPHAKLATKLAVVLETPTILLPLPTRIAAHSSVIEALPELWQMLN